MTEHPQTASNLLHISMTGHLARDGRSRKLLNNKL
jgi:hypothetical protein